MNTRIASVRMSRLLTTVAFAALTLLVLPSVATAAFVTTWTQSTTGTKISGLTTSSPTLGDNTTNSANGYQVYATLPTTYTLSSVGDSIVYSGSMSMTLSAGAASDQFRFGIFNSNGSSTTSGWLGYFATNSGSGSNPNGRLWERTSTNTTAYFNNSATNAVEDQAKAGSPTSSSTTSAFLSGTYDFYMSATRTETGLTIVWSIVGTGGTNYSISGTYADTSVLTYSFDRVGFMTGGGLNANQVSFSNIDVTYASAVPEPASVAVLFGAFAGLLVVGCRRRIRAA